MANSSWISLHLVLGLCSLSTPRECLGNEVTEKGNIIFEPVDYSLKDTDHIGTLKSGFVCLPSGTLRWADIRLPRDRDLAQEALETIKKSGRLDVPTTVQYQLKGRIDKFELKLCIAGLGIGEKKPTGRAKIDIQWTQSRWPEKTVIKSQVTHSEFDVRGIDPRKDSKPLQTALVENLLIFLDSNVTR